MNSYHKNDEGKKEKKKKTANTTTQQEWQKMLNQKAGLKRGKTPLRHLQTGLWCILTPCLSRLPLNSDFPFIIYKHISFFLVFFLVFLEQVPWISGATILHKNQPASPLTACRPLSLSLSLV